MSKSAARRLPPPPHELESATVAVSDLRPYPGNPRRGNVDVIKHSIEANGVYKRVVVNRPTMEVLAETTR